MIPAGVRRELHADAALASDETSSTPLPLEARALHAYNAQDSFEALMLLEQVADRAAARGDVMGCIIALRRGLDLARRADLPRRARRPHARRPHLQPQAR